MGSSFCKSSGRLTDSKPIPYSKRVGADKDTASLGFIEVCRLKPTNEGVDRGDGGTGIEGAESGVEGAESGVEGAGSGSRGGGKRGNCGRGSGKIGERNCFFY